ncbi:MAG TPA: DUF1501 domain-containing protein [Vicinamibacteria bacterium]
MARTRRDFLKRAACGAVGMTVLEPLLSKTAGRALAAAGDKTLVVVNLFGGNDGLNTVVPMTEYARYRQMRPTLGHAQAALLPLSGQPDFRLNPGLTALQSLYNQGKVAILNGVGVPKSATGLFDHSAQQFEFMTCDIVRNNNQAPPSGWVGRYLDGIGGGLVAPGIDMGGGKLMLTGATFDPLTINSLDELALKVSFDQTDRLAAYESIMGMPHGASQVGERNRVLRVEGLAQSAAIRNATANYVPLATYPDSSLADNLQQCARIIYGDLGVRAMGVGAGGFDTHGEQNDGAYHDNLLAEVGDAIGAFHADLTAHGLSDRVLILTISEFGRTPFQNGARGSDHGYGSVFFAIGDSVNGGIYGDYPHLADNWLVFGDLLDVTTDFRSVYATAFANFMGVDPVPIVGGNFPTLGYV